MIFTQEQEDIINGAIWHVFNSPFQVYPIAGRAGTGKSTVLIEIYKRLIAKGIEPDRIAVMAPTGAAAINLRNKGIYSASTIHSILYELVEIVERDKDDNVVINTTYNVPKIKLVFKPRDFVPEYDIFIIDEAYMVPLSMKYDIEKHGKKIIVVGDSNQLGPVEGEPAYLVNGDIHYLTQILRQDDGSAILYIADRALNGLPIHAGLYGNNVLVIEEKDLTLDMIRMSNAVICCTNRNREYYNRLVREEILGYRGRLPRFGERVICRKNNWNETVDGISLANGLVGHVINNPSPTDIQGNTFRIDFKPNNLGAYFENLECDYKYFTATVDQRKFLKYDKYSKGEKFEFAYSITTHLSQGSQYPVGIYISDTFGDNINRCKLSYVGATRFSKFLIYVIPTRK